MKIQIGASKMASKYYLCSYSYQTRIGVADYEWDGGHNRTRKTDVSEEADYEVLIENRKFEMADTRWRSRWKLTGLILFILAIQASKYYYLWTN